MLTVEYGPFQPSLEQAFLRALDGLRAEDSFGPLAVVAPSRRLADRLQRLITLESGKACLGVSFHTFHSLAIEIVRESPSGEPSWISDPMFFDRIIDSLLEESSRGSGKRPRGLAAAYRSSLKDLVDAGVEPRASELLEDGLLAGTEDQQRLKNLLQLLGRYAGKLNKLGVMPASGVVRRAIAAAPESAALARYRRLLYYGFYDLTGLQADFFEAVAREAPVTLFFPYRREHPAFAFADRFFETKLHLGGRTPRAAKSDGAGRPALGETLDALFVPGKTAPVPKGAVRIFTASGVRDEAWRAAKEILRLVEKEGAQFRDIGVVARSLDPYREAVVEAFEESGVPFHTSAARPLLRRPAARHCLSLLTLARRDFPALAVLDLTGSPFFRKKAGRHWRALVERLRIHRGWLQWEGRLAPAAKKDFALFPQLAAEGRPCPTVSRDEIGALWFLLREWRRRLTPEGVRRWSEWAAHARGILSDFLDPRAEDGKNDPGFDGVVENIEALAEFDRLGRKVSFNEFLDAVEERLARSSLPLGGKENQGVRLLDAMEARGDSFRFLFLLGLREGLFPRTIREDPLLRDAARDALRETGGYWISSKQAGYGEEKLLFSLLAGSAGERIYFSYPRSDENGRVQIPSIYLLEFCRAAGLRLSDPALTERVPRQPEQRLSMPHLADTLSPREASLAAALTGGGVPGAARMVARLRELNRRGEPGRMDGIIGPPKDYLAKLRVRGLSPSALETFARCPFQFFASRVLGLGEIEEPSERGEIAPAVKGEIYHRILKVFYEALGETAYWGQPERDFPEPVLAGAESAVFAEYGWRELGVYPLLWEIVRDGMRGHLRRFLVRDLSELRLSGLRPKFFEIDLTARLGVRLPAALSDMPFQGRIDRVDVGGGAFRVVDYKTRWRRPKRLEQLVLEGAAHQPPVYLELAARHPDLAGAESRGVRFLALEDSPEANGRETVHEYRAETHAKNRERQLSLLSRLVESVSEGRFPILPDTGKFGHCRWCSFGDLCRKNHAATLGRTRR